MNRRNFLKLCAAAPLVPLAGNKTQYFYHGEPVSYPKWNWNTTPKGVLDLTKNDVLTYRNLAKNYGHSITHDFATSLGDTIMEKYESIYVDIVRVSCIVHRKSVRAPVPPSFLEPNNPLNTHSELYKEWQEGIRGCNFIITTPEIALIFATATAGWNGPNVFGYWHEKPCGQYEFVPNPSIEGDIQYLGTVSNRWRVYISPHLEPWDMVLGCTKDTPSPSKGHIIPYKENWAYIKLINYVI